MKDIGVDGQISVYTSRTSKLHIITMYTKYCILTVLPHCMKTLRMGKVNHCYSLIHILNKLPFIFLAANC